jgi:hypothetical protein
MRLAMVTAQVELEQANAQLASLQASSEAQQDESEPSERQGRSRAMGRAFPKLV